MLVCLAQQILMKDKRDRTKSLQTPRREPSESLWNEKTKIENPPKKRQELVVFKVFQVGSTGGAGSDDAGEGHTWGDVKVMRKRAASCVRTGEEEARLDVLFC